MIYLDPNATTPVPSIVRKAVTAVQASHRVLLRPSRAPRYGNRTLAVILFTVCFHGLCSGADWELVNPQPTGTSLFKVIWTGSQIVATGSLGSVLTSSDGERWTKTRITDPAGEYIDLSQLTWSGRLMVAAANVTGIVWSSLDGRKWTRVEVGFPVRISRLVWTGSQFAGVGSLVVGSRSSQVFVSSPDGSKWTYAPTSVSGGWIRDIAWTGNGYIATGSLTTTLNQAKSIINFLWWKNVTGAVVDVPFAAYSKDGKSWRVKKLTYSSAPPDRPLSIVWTGKKALILTMEGRIYTSVDGISWSGETRPDGLMNIFASNLIWTGQELIAIGSLQDSRKGKTPPAFFTSPGGENWVERSPVVSRITQFTDATKAGDQYVAVGSGGLIQTSPDGDNWTIRSPLGLVERVSKVASNGTQFVAVGGDAVLTSANGVNWSVAHPAHFDTNSVVWAGTQYIAVGKANATFTSPDGKKWTAHQRENSGTLSDVAWNGKTAVAVGFSNEGPSLILSSEDGITWKQETQPSGTRDLDAVTWSGSQFVAVGDNASIVTSPDGYAWTKVHGKDYDPYLRGIAWSGTTFVAVGVSRWGGRPNAFVSPDGKSWSGVTIPCALNFNAVGWCSDHFVAAGERGVIFVSKDGTSWTRDPLVAESNFTGVLGTADVTLVVGSEGTIVRKD
jgi:hypothetical protein